MAATVYNPKLGYDLKLWRKHIDNQTRRPDLVHVEPDPEKFNYWDENVSYAREQCRLKALKNGYAYIWFVDVDVLVPADALEKLLDVNGDIVCGKYRHKEEGLPFFWFYEYVPPERRAAAAKRYGKQVVLEDVFYMGSQTRRINKAGTGCMLIRRNVLERIPFPLKVPKKWTEDVIYSIMAEALGFEIWAVPSVDCKHVGPSAQPLKIERGGIPTR